MLLFVLIRSVSKSQSGPCRKDLDILKDARKWDRNENKWERLSTATWLKGVTKVEQSTAILDIVQSGHGLTSFYRYY